MRIRTLAAAGATVCAVGVLAATPGAGAARPAVASHHTAEGVIAKKADSDTSLNWSGYAVNAPSGHKITGVHTRFVVPVAHGSSPGGAALWAGVGGWNGAQDLIQAGVSTGDITASGNYAWYEMLPDSEIPLSSGCKGDPNCTVNAGDAILVNVANVKGTTWNISLTDVNHWSWSKTVDYQSTFASAEWILEAPSIILPMFVPNVDNTTFGPGNTFTVDHGAPRKMGSGNPTNISMALLGILSEATASPVAKDGDRFRSCTFKSACPTP